MPLFAIAAGAESDAACTKAGHAQSPWKPCAWGGGRQAEGEAEEFRVIITLALCDQLISNESFRVIHHSCTL